MDIDIIEKVYPDLKCRLLYLFANNKPRLKIEFPNEGEIYTAEMTRRIKVDSEDFKGVESLLQIELFIIMIVMIWIRF